MNTENNAAQQIVDDIHFGKALLYIVEKYNIPSEHERDFINTVGDTILGTIPKHLLSQKIQAILSLPQIDAERIILKLRPFLDQIPVPEAPAANNELKERLELRPEAPKNEDSVVPPQEGSMKPLTRAEVLEALAPKRTMESDIAALQPHEGE